MAARPHVVVAEFRLKPGCRERFLEIARNHARTSLAREPGCRQFDVVEAGEEAMLFYEVYADAEAFARHKTEPHLERFREATAALVQKSHRREFKRASDGRAAPAGRVLVAIPVLRGREAVLARLEEAGFEIVFTPYERMMDEDELLGMLDGVVATIAGTEPYNARTLAGAGDLKVVARLGVGFDQIDLEAATRHGVAVAMAFGTNHDAVADHAFAMMAALAHRLRDYDRDVREGRWGTRFHGRLYGATVGIVGFGRIGRSLARRCQGFAMRVLVADPAVDAATVARLGCSLVPLETLLGESDFVSLHAPMLPETARLIDGRALDLMKPTAYLVNTARGGLVDEDALIEALESGRIAGAGLDVLAEEPPTRPELGALANVLLTPHVAGLGAWAVDRMAEKCVDNILAVLAGQDPGGGALLNPEALTSSCRRHG